MNAGDNATSRGKSAGTPHSGPWAGVTGPAAAAIAPNFPRTPHTSEALSCRSVNGVHESMPANGIASFQSRTTHVYELGPYSCDRAICTRTDLCTQKGTGFLILAVPGRTCSHVRVFFKISHT